MVLRRALASALIALIMIGAAGCGGHDEAPSIAVGAPAAPVSALVAHLYAAALRFYGNPAHVQSMTDPLSGLDSGEVRVVPGFTGRLPARVDPEGRARAAARVY